MKKIILFLATMLISIAAFSQSYRDKFVGTWVYESNDTVFTIKLQKGEFIINTRPNMECLFGGYSLKVGGVMNENYIKTMPTTMTQDSYPPSSNIYLYGWAYSLTHASFTFFDQRIKHLKGEGIFCGKLLLLNPDTLRWTLDEEEGVWYACEGEFDDENEPEHEWEIKGFSVPINVIMTKVQDGGVDNSKDLNPNSIPLN